MSSKNRHDLRLHALVDALARSVAEASDEEVLEDARSAGVDLNANAAQLKQMLSETATRFRKRKFFEARQLRVCNNELRLTRSGHEAKSRELLARIQHEIGT